MVKIKKRINSYSWDKEDKMDRTEAMIRRIAVMSRRVATWYVGAASFARFYEPKLPESLQGNKHE